MRELEQFLGDGGMPLLGELGVEFTEYGAGWSAGSWNVTDTCLNPSGGVQAGVFATALDAAMSFALVAALEKGERGVTLHMSVQTIRPAGAGDALTMRGQTTRVAKTVAYCSATITRNDEIIATATATFAVRRDDGN